jgi:hypothetical protein
MAGLVLAAILLYRFHRPLARALSRFDATNAARRAEEMRDRQDRLAHFKHTMRLAEEQVEEISEVTNADVRTGLPTKHFLFEGEMFASQDEAEAARQRSVVAKARAFYLELPAALAARGDGKLR